MADNVPDITVPLPLNLLGLGLPGIGARMRNERAEQRYAFEQAEAERARQLQAGLVQDAAGAVLGGQTGVGGMGPPTADFFRTNPQDAARRLAAIEAGLGPAAATQLLETRLVDPLEQAAETRAQAGEARAQAAERRTQALFPEQLAQARIGTEAAAQGLVDARTAARNARLDRRREAEERARELRSDTFAALDDDIDLFAGTLAGAQQAAADVLDAIDNGDVLSQQIALKRLAALVEPTARQQTDADIALIQLGTGQSELVRDLSRLVGLDAGQELGPEQKAQVRQVVNTMMVNRAQDAVRRLVALQAEYGPEGLTAEDIDRRLRIRTGQSLESVFDLARPEGASVRRVPSLKRGRR